MKKYQRTASSPYPKGSEEDQKLSKAAAEFSAKNRENLKRVLIGPTKRVEPANNWRRDIKGNPTKIRRRGGPKFGTL